MTEPSSVLQVTNENQKCEKLIFLNYIVTRINEKFHTGLWVEHKSDTACITFKIVCPERQQQLLSK